MNKTLSRGAGLLAFSLLLAAACGKTKPPKQAEADDALTDKGSDMSAGDEGNGGMLKAKPGEKSGEEQMHEKCCGQCKQGLAADRSKSDPATIPCADFTAALDPFCLEHFRGRKTMANQCK